MLRWCSSERGFSLFDAARCDVLEVALFGRWCDLLCCSCLRRHRLLGALLLAVRQSAGHARWGSGADLKLIGILLRCLRLRPPGLAGTAVLLMRKLPSAMRLFAMVRCLPGGCLHCVPNSTMRCMVEHRPMTCRSRAHARRKACTRSALLLPGGAGGCPLATSSLLMAAARGRCALRLQRLPGVLLCLMRVLQSCHPPAFALHC